jgi:hypothetical protein
MLDAMDWLLSIKCPLPKTMIPDNIQLSVRCVEWLVAHQPELTFPNIKAVCLNGNIDVLQWFHTKHLVHLEIDHFYASLRSGHIPCIEWVWSKMENKQVLIRHDFREYLLLHEFRRSGNLIVLKWLIRHGFMITKPNISTWIICEFSSGVTFANLQNMELLLRWMNANNISWTDNGDEYRPWVTAGRKDMIHWLHARHCPLNMILLLEVSAYASLSTMIILKNIVNNWNSDLLYVRMIEGTRWAVCAWLTSMNPNTSSGHFINMVYRGLLDRLEYTKAVADSKYLLTEHTGPVDAHHPFVRHMVDILSKQTGHLFCD